MKVLRVIPRIEENDQLVEVCEAYFRDRWFVNTRYESIDIPFDKLWSFAGPDQSWHFQHHSLASVSHLIDGLNETKDHKYLDLSKKIIFDWYEVNYPEPPSDMSWDPHVTAWRLINICRFFVEYKKSSSFTKKSLRLLQKIAQTHCEKLADSKFYIPRHPSGIDQDMALFTAANLFCSIKWEELALKRFEKQLDHLFGKDGGYLEHSPQHVYHLLQNFYSFLDFLDQIKHRNTNLLAERLEKTVRYLIYAMQPNGEISSIGDSENESVDLSVIESWKLKSQELAYFIEQLRMGKADFEEDENTLPLDKAFMDAGFAQVRNKWSFDQETTQIMMYSGFHSRKHKHYDDLSFVLFNQGVPLITEGGKYSYEYNSTQRQYIISPYAHNSVMVDEKPADIRAQNAGSSGLLSSLFTKNIAYTSGIHALYLDINHRRIFVYFKPDILIIIDKLDGVEHHSFDTFFNLHWKLDCVEKDQAFYGYLNGEKVIKIADIFSNHENIERIVSKGEVNPLKGWASPSHGEIVPNSLIQYRGKGRSARNIYQISLGKSLEKEEKVEALWDENHIQLVWRSYKVDINLTDFYEHIYIKDKHYRTDRVFKPKLMEAIIRNESEQIASVIAEEKEVQDIPNITSLQVKQNLDKITAAYFEQNSEEFGRQTRDRIHWICEQAKGESVLDVGCSAGIVDILLAREGKRVLAIDPLEDVIQYAKDLLVDESITTKEFVDFQVLNFITHDFKSSQFDAVIFSEVLGNVKGLEHFLKKADLLLNEVGRIVITLPLGTSEYFENTQFNYLTDIIEALPETLKISHYQFSESWLGIVLENNSVQEAVALHELFSALENQLMASGQRQQQQYHALIDKNTQLIEEKDQLTKKLEQQTNELKSREESIHEALKEKEIMLKKFSLNQTEYELTKTISVNDEHAVDDLTIKYDFDQSIEIEMDNLLIPEAFSDMCKKVNEEITLNIPHGQYAYLQTSAGSLSEINTSDLIIPVDAKKCYELGISATTSEGVSLELVALGFLEGAVVEARAIQNHTKELMRFERNPDLVKILIRLQGQGSVSGIKIGHNETVEEPFQSISLKADDWFKPENAQSEIYSENEMLIINAELSSDETNYLSYLENNIGFSKVPDVSTLEIKHDRYYEFYIQAETSDTGRVVPLLITYSDIEKDQVIHLKLNQVNRIRFKDDITSCRLAFKVNGTAQFVIQSFTIAQYSLSSSTAGEMKWLDAKEVSLLGIMPKKELSKVKLAVIFDEFTRQCFEDECQLISFTPENWKEVFMATQPDLLMVESAWHGNNGAWTKKVQYQDEASVKELKELIGWCRASNIPTVFWNKEDPVNYEHFIETAKLFDLVLTTDQNMVPKYKEDCGHDRVDYLQFAAQSAIHNPITIGERENAVSFAGSWYAKYPERQEDMVRMFHAAEPYGLVIFDRNYEKVKMGLLPNFRFPEHLEPYIRGSLKYYEIDKAYKGFKALININTVKDSPTMFARRVFESLASGTPVISNYSEGVEKLFGDIACTAQQEDKLRDHLKMLFEDKEQYRHIVLEGVRRVFGSHTYSHRLEKIIDLLDLPFYRKEPKLLVLGKADSSREAQNIYDSFKKQIYSNKELCLLVEEEVEIELLNIDDSDVQIFKTVDFYEHYKNISEYTTFDYLAVMSPNLKYSSNHLLDLGLATLYAPWDIIAYHQGYELSFTQVYEAHPNYAIFKQGLFKLLSIEEMFDLVANKDLSSLQKSGARILGIPSEEILVN